MNNTIISGVDFGGIQHKKTPTFQDNLLSLSIPELEKQFRSLVDRKKWESETSGASEQLILTAITLQHRWISSIDDMVISLYLNIGNLTTHSDFINSLQEQIDNEENHPDINNTRWSISQESNDILYQVG